MNDLNYVLLTRNSGCKDIAFVLIDKGFTEYFPDGRL